MYLPEQCGLILCRNKTGCCLLSVASLFIVGAQFSVILHSQLCHSLCFCWFYAGYKRFCSFLLCSLASLWLWVCSLASTVVAPRLVSRFFRSGAFGTEMEMSLCPCLCDSVQTVSLSTQCNPHIYQERALLAYSYFIQKKKHTKKTANQIFSFWDDLLLLCKLSPQICYISLICAIILTELYEKF